MCFLCAVGRCVSDGRQTPTAETRRGYRIGRQDMQAEKTVIVGMSGGVDSSVAAYLLLKQGLRVEGLFMQNWEEDGSGHCTAAADLLAAAKACKTLGIPLRTAQFSAEYRERVFAHFLAELRQGRTPNPDILCNREIKFRVFADHAAALGADAIATGHYVRCERDEDGQVRLLRGTDPDKDQSYFLHTVPADRLARALFPLGTMQKSEVRTLARQVGLANHDRPDSTGICFIGERNFPEFLAGHLPLAPGEIVSTEGGVLGRHRGLACYTLGQRRGLGIGGVAGGSEPWYVVAKDRAHNRLLVARGRNHPALFRQRLRTENISWIDGRGPELPHLCTARIRYRQPDQACSLQAAEESLQVHFDEPQWAVTPGQSVVFYEGIRCLGGGVIADDDENVGRAEPPHLAERPVAN